VNLRWPYAQYRLLHWDIKHVNSSDRGSCDIIFFVRDGILFQIHPLKLGFGSSVTSR
ncbi:hypothetical protein B0T21DRAFT_288496, partial [Apiosordaria backusii]